MNREVGDTFRARDIAHALCRGEVVSDHAYDSRLPTSVRAASKMYWTPIAVALRAAQWLAEFPSKRVIDVGAGPGKFCILGALTTGAQFVALEQRAELIKIAESSAKAFGVEDRISFVHGTLSSVDITQFDAMYFYNPFAENMYRSDAQFDNAVELSPSRYFDDIFHIEDALQRATNGLRIATYHGYGGRIPSNFRLERREAFGSGLLRFWEKTESQQSARYFLEDGIQGDQIAYANWPSLMRIAP